MWLPKSGTCASPRAAKAIRRRRPSASTRSESSRFSERFTASSAASGVRVRRHLVSPVAKCLVVTLPSATRRSCRRAPSKWRCSRRLGRVPCFARCTSTPARMVRAAAAARAVVSRETCASTRVPHCGKLPARHLSGTRRLSALRSRPSEALAARTATRTAVGDASKGVSRETSRPPVTQATGPITANSSQSHSACLSPPVQRRRSEPGPGPPFIAGGEGRTRSTAYST